MKPTITSALIVLAIILFFVGRFTAPVKMVEDTHKIDSLIRDAAKHERREAILKDSVNHYKILSDTWFEQAQNKKIERVIIYKYNADTAKISKFSKDEIDSAFIKRYGN